MSRYYVADGMVQRGPFALPDLPGQGLRPDMLVWKEGMEDWRRADQVAEIIFSGLLPSTPARPASTGYQPIYSTPPYNPANSNRVAAGVCGIFLGGLGIHKFILGMTTPGVIMLLVTVLSCGIAYPVMHIIGLIEGILYLTKNDVEFYQTYIVGQKEWF